MDRTSRTKAKLGDVVSVLAGGTWGTADDLHGMRVLRTNNIGPDFVLNLDQFAARQVGRNIGDRLKMMDGDILMTKSNSLDRVGDCGIFVQPRGDNAEYVPSNFCQLIRFKTDYIDPWFGLLLLRSPQAQTFIRNAATGTSASLKNISARKLRDLYFEFPPVPEQQRIVAKVRNCFDRITELRGLQADKLSHPSRIRNAYIIELLGLQDCSDWSRAYDFGRFEWKDLQSTCSLVSRGRHSAQGDSDTFLIKTRHVWPEGIKDYSDCRLSQNEAGRVADVLHVQARDVLVACSARGSLGRCSFIPNDVKSRVTVDTHVAILRAKPDVIDARLLFEFLNCSLGNYLLVSAEAGGRWHEEKIGFRFAELNLRDLKAIRVPVPTISEQQAILHRIDAFDAILNPICRDLASTKDAAAKLAGVVLRHAVSGEL